MILLNSTAYFDWAVIGAGPAGIAAVGKLIDAGVSPQNIAWVDPDFTVGDFGSKWRSVPSNTKVNLFLQFLSASEAFNYKNCNANFALHRLNPEETCALYFMVEPLQWITAHLKKQVRCYHGLVQQLTLAQRCWKLSLLDTTLHSKNVVLAIGAEPKTLSADKAAIIPLDVAFDRDQLGHYCTTEDTIAVFGSSHSAILIIRNLIEATSVKKVINFYQSPLRYAIDLGEEILFDDTGLKGTTADWARDHIDGVHPHKLSRVLSSDINAQKYLSQCTKAIYAIGFQRRSIAINGLQAINYNDRSGIIAPGLFGLGIAFPEAKTDRFGTLEYRVGLWKFMDYLTRILPVWLRYHT